MRPLQKPPLPGRVESSFIRTFSTIPWVNSDQGGLLKNLSSLLARNSSRPASTPHLRAFAVIARRRGAAESPPRSEEETFSWMRGTRKRGKRRQAPHQGRPAGSVRPAILLPALGTALSRPGNDSGERAGNFDKIPNNTINIDKFTGIFDKKRKRDNIVTHCNEMICFIYPSAGDSNMSANFFRAPHLR